MKAPPPRWGFSVCESVYGYREGACLYFILVLIFNLVLFLRAGLPPRMPQPFDYWHALEIVWVFTETIVDMITTNT
jgi:hypothetical protein